jgi:hypothetical protein
MHLLDILVLWRHCLALVTASALIVYAAFDERRNGLLIGSLIGHQMVRRLFLYDARTIFRCKLRARVARGMRIWRANGNLYASCARDMSKAACRAGDGGLRIMYGMRDTRRLRTGTTRRKANLRREVI